MSVDLNAVPESAPPAQVEVGGTIAQVWKNIFPWSDLNAKLPPERFLSLGPEILPSLAVLAAQGPDQPRLLQTDLLARLVTVGSLNAVDKATAQKLIGSGVIVVNNPNLFAPGSFVAVQPAAGGATLANSQFYQVLGPTTNPGELLIAPALTAQVNPGDFVVGVPAVWIAGQSLNVQVGNSIAVNSLPAITIAAAQQVNIGNTVTVAGTINIGNTPSVTIASGTVNIGNTVSINIAAQGVTVNVAQPQQALADLSFPVGLSTQTTAAVPAGTHALQLTVIGVVALTGVAVHGHQTGAVYAPLDVFGTSDTLLGGNATFVIPVNSIQDTTYDVRGNNNGGAAVTVKVSAILDTQAVWVQNRLDLPVYTLDAGRVNALGGKKRTLQPPATYENIVSSAPASGSQASVTTGSPSAGLAWEAVHVSWSIAQTAAAAAAVDVVLQDGASTIWDETAFGPAGAGNGSHAEINDGGFPATAGNTMTLKFTSAVGSNLERVNLGVVATN